MHDPGPVPPAATPVSRRALLKVLLAAPALAAVPAVPAPAASARVTAPAIVPFIDWAPAGCPPPAADEMATTRRLVVHHTYDPVAPTASDVLPALATTCGAHVGRGFSTIGYHYAVDPWGTVYQGRGLLPGPDGRAPAAQPEGAHVAGSNPGAVGVVLIGDHETAPPTAAASAAATHVLAWLLQDLGVGPADRVPTLSTGVGTARFRGRFHPRAIAGHSASNRTACPGHHLAEQLPAIRDGVRALLGSESVAPSAGASSEPRPAGGTAESTTGPASGTGPGLRVPPVPRASPAEVSAERLRAAGLPSLADQLLSGMPS